MDVLKRWLPVAVWSALILAASSDRFSSEGTASFLRDVVGIDLPEWLHHTLRKLGHVIGYGILGALGMRASHPSENRREGRPGGTPALPSFAIVFLVAILDESLQATTVSRTGTPWDVLLDIVAGSIAIALLVQKWRLK